MPLRSSIRLGFTLAALAVLCGCGSGDSSNIGADAGSVVVQPPPSPSSPSSANPVTLVLAAAAPITGSDRDYTHIMAGIAPVRRVLLGESTHGTAEYYRERGRITERLVSEHGVNAVTIEGDWSPTFRINLYVRGLGNDRSASEALQGYAGRFPGWMWRNVEFRDFIERLRTVNLTRPPQQRVGIYGMDVYDLYDAADQVVSYLQDREPGAATRVRQLYACFAPFDRRAETYGQSVAGKADTCREEAEAAAAELSSISRPTDPEQVEHHFGAGRAAASVVAAEAYYRTSYTGNESSWNVRDRRMAETIEAVAAHVEAQSGMLGKTVSWTHNTHAGNAAATSSASNGELNLGQLLRERHGNAALLVGFFSYSGTVFAAPQWGASGQVYSMRPAAEGSHSFLFHETGLPAFSLLIRGNPALTSALQSNMPQRAIGVVYLPQTEAQSHYLRARLADQFDAAVFFDQSRAVTPL